MPDITNAVAAQPQGLVVEYTLVLPSVISCTVLTRSWSARCSIGAAVACGSTSGLPRRTPQHVYAVRMVGSCGP